MSTNNPYAPPKGTVRDAPQQSASEPADRLLRLAAVILDGIVFACLVYLPAVIGLAATGGFTEEPGAMALGLGGVLAVAGFAVWVWLTILYVARNGQTIAKKIVGIKVVRKDGSPASLGRIFWLRNVVNGLLSIVPLYGLIDILFIFGEERQCIHDKIADTIVVRA